MSDQNHDKQAPMRRQPRQARGRERVAQILDAAEQLFGELGYEATTTNLIAARAGVPIGSIYQYFPHKEAILHAVAERYREAGGALIDRLLAAGAAERPVEELVERFLEAIVEFGAARIGFTRIVLQAGGDPHLLAAASALHSTLIDRLERLIAVRAPELPPDRRVLIARVAVTAMNALLALAIAEKPHGEAAVEAIISETGRLLVAYVSSAAS